MKKTLFFLTASLSLYASVPTIYMAPPSSYAKAAVEGGEEEQKKHSTKSPLAEMEKAAAAKDASIKGSTEMMIISPEGRAKDIQAAIKFLKLHAPTAKPSIKLTDGAIIKGIVDIDVMPGGTLVIFKVASLKGLKYQIVKIENIDTIETNGT
ncbi:MAG: hypothetical protein KFB93_01015 [Simkaniaceae bacterium]|nr:MAG: hypothetical protein KFB93_01015 [Simkaniaceae bacterium]